MNELGRSCFPTMKTLTRQTSLSRRSVQRALVELEEAGWLQRSEEKLDPEENDSQWGALYNYARLPDGHRRSRRGASQ